MEIQRRNIDFRISAENLPLGTVILIPLAIIESPNTTTYSEITVELTTTSVGFYRGWQAHFYWSEFGTVS